MASLSFSEKQEKYFRMFLAAVVMGTLTHFSLETPIRVTGKQNMASDQNLQLFAIKHTVKPV